MRHAVMIIGLLLCTLPVLAGCAAGDANRARFSGAYVGGSASGAQEHAQGQP